MSGEPTVMFCVGAAKAGTSWLYRYLEQHPDCHMRGIKELHYFDGYDLQNREWQVAQLQKDRAALKAKLDAGRSKSLDVLARRVEAHDDLIRLNQPETEDAGAYLDYLNKGRSDQKLIGDLTPAYGLLSEDRFAKMAAISPNVRFIYILRDPIARLWSHIRMLAQRRVSTPEHVQQISERIFWRFGRGRFPPIWARSDYREALQKLDNVVGAGQLFTLFYEELFTQKSMRQICGFLGIDNSVAPVKEQVHIGPQATMDGNMINHARKWLAPQYEFVEQRAGYLPDQWQGFDRQAKLLGVGT